VYASGRKIIVSVLCLKCVYMCVFNCVSVYMLKERERERERDKMDVLRYLLRSYDYIYNDFF
jgi:hypothetical protein